MRTRQTTIQAFQAHAAPGTDVYPIRLTDPISRLVIPYSVLCVAAVRAAHMSQAFTNISIVDGSDVLMSLTGSEIDGIARMRALSAPATFEQNDQSVTVWGNLVIDFGRYQYDKLLALDASKFKNPQILVTHNAATICAGAVVTSYGILAQVMEGLSSAPQGYLMKKEVRSYLCSAAGWDVIKMPVDFPYRAIWIKALTTNVSLDNHWSRAILDEDNSKRIPFDALIDDQIADNAAKYGLITELVSGGTSSNAAPLFAAPAYAGAILVMNITGTAFTYGITNDGGRYYAVSATTTDDFRGVCQGLAPQGMVVFDMGEKDTLEDWYDPTGVGALQLSVLGVTARTIRVVTEQLRPNVPR